MKKSDKANRIQEILDTLFPVPDIPLQHHDPFTLLVAVLLSAQTTDARVNLITPALFAKARTPEEMARLPVATIHKIIQSCGLAPGKARNIRELSRLLVQRHQGQVPADMDALEALPGVGHKTASVVLAQAFGKATFPVDTHIHRLAWRWGLSSGRSVEQTERDLKRTFPKESWSRLHLQMIYFGRKYCPARGHHADTCPICSWAGRREVRTPHVEAKRGMKKSGSKKATERELATRRARDR